MRLFLRMLKFNFTIASENPKYPMLMDATLPESSDTLMTPILFIHGFKGFKDWGTFNMMADAFAKNGLAFFKANLSHNGTTPDHPLDFADLQSFSKNTFSIEMSDIRCQIDFLMTLKANEAFQKIDWTKLIIIGHSRGGGIALLQAQEDKRIHKLVTWAGISDFAYAWTPDFVKAWKEKGQHIIPNSRTGQDMPMRIDIYNDFMENQDTFNILKRASRLNKPYLIIHGSQDETLNSKMAYDLKDACPSAELIVIDGAGHTFGAAHPWNQPSMPMHFQELVEETIDFIKK